MNENRIKNRREISLVTAFVFLWTSVMVPVPAADSQAQPPQLSAKLELTRFFIPKEFGTVSERFLPPASSRPPVIYLLDAHANYDAQKSIQKIINLLQTDYHLPLVAMEGAVGELKPFLFRAFPEKSIQEKVFEDLVTRGEVSGVDLASVLNPRWSDFVGIEEKKLYQLNREAFIHAVQNKARASSEIDKRLRLNLEQKKKIYSPELFELDQAEAGFESNSKDLMQLLKWVAKQKISTSEFPALDILLNEMKRGESRELYQNENINVGLMRLATIIKSDLRAKELEKYESLYRSFRKGEGRRVFVIFLIRKARQRGLPSKFYSSIWQEEQGRKKLSALATEDFYRELHALIAQLKESLFRTNRQRKLDREFHQLKIYKKLVSLEVTRDELLTVFSPPAGRRPHRASADSNVNAGPVSEGALTPSEARREIDLKELLRPAFRFYELALKRDQVLFRSLTQKMKERKVPFAAVVTGGFHAEGVKQLLKKEGYPYLVISPRIRSVGESPYLDVMLEKNLSYQKYWKPKAIEELSQIALMDHLDPEMIGPDRWKAVEKEWSKELLQIVLKERGVNLRIFFRAWYDTIVKQSLDLGWNSQEPRGELKALWRHFTGEFPIDPTSRRVLRRLRKELYDFTTKNSNRTKIWNGSRRLLRQIRSGSLRPIRPEVRALPKRPFDPAIAYSKEEIDKALQDPQKVILGSGLNHIIYYSPTAFPRHVIRVTFPEEVRAQKARLRITSPRIEEPAQQSIIGKLYPKGLAAWTGPLVSSAVEIQGSPNIPVGAVLQEKFEIDLAEYLRQNPKEKGSVLAQLATLIQNQWKEGVFLPDPIRSNYGAHQTDGGILILPRDFDRAIEFDRVNQKEIFAFLANQRLHQKGYLSAGEYLLFNLLVSRDRFPGLFQILFKGVAATDIAKVQEVFSQATQTAAQARKNKSKVFFTSLDQKRNLLNPVLNQVAARVAQIRSRPEVRETAEEEVLDLASRDSKAWIVFADMMRLNLRDAGYGRGAADFFIEEVVRIAGRVTGRYAGHAFRIGDRADEVAMILPSRFSQKQVERILMEIQNEIKMTFQNFGYAQLTSSLSASHLKRLKAQGAIISTQRLPYLTDDGLSTKVTPALLFKKGSKESEERALRRIFRKAGLSRPQAMIEKVEVPYLPAGAVRLVEQGGQPIDRLANSLKKAELFQAIVKERGLLVGVEGGRGMAIRKREQGELFSSSVKSRIESELKKWKAKHQDSPYLKEEIYGVFQRKELIRILKDILKKPPQNFGTLVIRGPPDNFFVISAEAGKWQVTLVQPVVVAAHTPRGRTLQEAFDQILAKAGRHAREPGKFGFKVVNDYEEFGHHFGNQLIQLESTELTRGFNRAGKRMLLSKNPSRLLGRTLDKALQEIEKQTRREGFTIEFDVTSVSSDDFQAGVTGARVLRVLDRLSRARETTVIHTNEALYPGVRIKAYSENKTPRIQKEIKEELLIARAHLRKRAFDELRAAQARVEPSRRAEIHPESRPFAVPAHGRRGRAEVRSGKEREKYFRELENDFLTSPEQEKRLKILPILWNDFKYDENLFPERVRELLTHAFFDPYSEIRSRMGIHIQNDYDRKPLFSVDYLLQLLALAEEYSAKIKKDPRLPTTKGYDPTLQAYNGKEAILFALSSLKRGERPKIFSDRNELGPVKEVLAPLKGSFDLFLQDGLPPSQKPDPNMFLAMESPLAKAMVQVLNKFVGSNPLPWRKETVEILLTTIYSSRDAEKIVRNMVQAYQDQESIQGFVRQPQRAEVRGETQKVSEPFSGNKTLVLRPHSDRYWEDGIRKGSEQVVIGENPEPGKNVIVRVSRLDGDNKVKMTVTALPEHFEVLRGGKLVELKAGATNFFDVFLELGNLLEIKERSTGKLFKIHFLDIKNKKAQLHFSLGVAKAQFEYTVRPNKARINLAERYPDLSLEDAEVELKIDTLFDELKISTDAGPTALGWHGPIDPYRGYLLIRAMKIPSEGNVILVDPGSGQGEFALRVAMKHPNVTIIAIEQYLRLVKDAESLVARAIQKGWIQPGQIQIKQGNYNDPKFSNDFKRAQLATYYVVGTNNVAGLANTLIQHLTPGARVFEVGAIDQLGQILTPEEAPPFKLIHNELYVRGFERLPQRAEVRGQAEGLRALVGITREGKVEAFEFQFLRQLRQKLNQRLSGIVKESVELLIIPSIDELRIKIGEMAENWLPEIPKEKLEALIRRTWNVLNSLNQEAAQTILTESGTRLMERLVKKDPKLIREAASNAFKPIYELIRQLKSNRPLRVIMRIGASGEDQDFLDRLLRRLWNKENSELIITAEVQNAEHSKLRQKAQQKLMLLRKEGIYTRVNFESSANESRDIERWYRSALANGRVPVVISPQRLEALMNQIHYNSNSMPEVLETSIDDLMAALAVELFGELIDPQGAETQALIAQLLPELKERGVIIAREQGRWVASLDKQIIQKILNEIEALEAQRVAA